VIDITLHAADGSFQEQVPPEQVGDLLRTPQHMLWLDLADPADQDIGFLRQQFGFHELALEDVRRGHQRPKVEEYEDHYFLVLYAARYEDHELRLSEIEVFVGPNYVVTVHRGPLLELGETKERWLRDHSQFGQEPGWLVYSLLDAIVDRCFPILDQLSDEMDDIEVAIFGRPDQSVLRRLFAQRRELLALRRVVAPERDVLNVLLRGDLSNVLDDRSRPYLQDIYDHLNRLLDSIDLQRDLLSNALDAYLSVVSNSLNMVMRRLTALTVIIMVPTLIAGVYGMNFRFMPELEWPVGYFGALGLMGTVAALLALVFWRSRWL